MSVSRLSIFLPALLIFFTGCSASKEEGQRILAQLDKVLENSTVVLEKITDEKTADRAADQLKELAQEWNVLHELDQKYKFTRSNWDQLIKDNPEGRQKTANLKIHFTSEFDRVTKLKLSSDALQTFEKACRTCLRTE
jgi:thiamine kinase-like enzyme